MNVVTFEYCALYYLNWWLTRDCKYCEAFKGHDETAQREALQDAATNYRVARNLPLEFDHHIGLARLQPVLDAIVRPKRTDFDRPNLIRTILSVRDSVSKAYGGNDLLSLTTKFLWLRLKHPIIIYDGNARRALGTPDGDLPEFYERWRARYSMEYDKIADVCQALHRIQQFCIDPSVASPQFITELSSEGWFRERVFDIYLWHIGA